MHDLYEFRLNGEHFQVRVDDGTMEIRQGPGDKADFVLSGDSRTLLQDASGRLTPLDALAGGSLTLHGDTAAAQRCAEISGLGIDLSEVA